MKATIQKWGNSLALRIPLAVAKQIQVKEGDPVDLTVTAAGLTVEPAKRDLRLDDVIDQVTPENFHESSDWGAELGREAVPS